MAQFDADINLRVAVEGLQKAVRQVESAVEKIKDINLKVKADGQNELKKLEGSFKRLVNLAKTLGASAGIGGLSAALAALNTKPIVGGFLDANFIGGVVKGYGDLASAAAQAAAAQPGLAAGIAAASAAVLAFAPQLARATKDTLKLAKVAAEAQVPIENLIKGLALKTVGRDLGGFGDASEAVEVFRNRLRELNESVSNLRSRSSSLSSTLNKFNSDSETAAKIANKLVDVNARLNNELREQADLLRSASGVNVTELEAAKGRNSLETRRKADDFRKQQARDQAQLDQALLQLEGQRQTSLERVLGLEERRVDLLAERNRLELAERAAQPIVRNPDIERQQRVQEIMQRGRSVRAARDANTQASLRQQQAVFTAIQNQVNAMRVLDKVGTIVVFNTKLQNQLAKQIGEAIQKDIAQYNQRLADQEKLNNLLKEGAKIRASYAKDRKDKGFGANFRGQRGASLAASVGFPLLFGGGPGAIIGGGLGSILGKGGFGLDILLSTLGTQFDLLGQRATELGAALDETTFDAAKVTEALGFQGQAVQRLLEETKEVAGTAEAAAAASSLLAATLGDDAVQAFNGLDDATKRLNEAAAILNTEFAALAATLLGPVLNAIAGLIREQMLHRLLQTSHEKVERMQHDWMLLAGCQRCRQKCR